MNKNFITFEGGEGAGKSTLIRKLAAWLGSLGLQVVTTREPGGTPLAEQIRHLLLQNQDSSMNSRTELFLLLAARADHTDRVIIPALAAGKIVLCDRFHDSTIAYQGGGRSQDSAQLEQFCAFSSASLEPSLTLLLDVDPSIGLERARRRRQRLDRLEQEDAVFHAEVRKAFLQQAEQSPSRIRLLDGMAPAAVVFSQAKIFLSNHLNVA